jgi:hypothetical protein
MRDARTQLMLCVADTCPGPVREDCASRLNEVEAATPTVIFEVRDSGDQDLSAVKVTMDGQPLVDRLDGTAVRLDTGPHKFQFTSEGFRTETRDLVLREGDKNRRERVVLLPAGAAASASPDAAPSPGAAPAPVPAAGEANEARGDGSTQRMLGLALGGVGAVGLVVGTIFGITSKSAYEHAHTSECGSAIGVDTPNVCSPSGSSDVHSAYGQATVSTVAFVAGAALLGGGAFLYFTAPRSAPGATSALGVGPGGLSLRGTW